MKLAGYTPTGHPIGIKTEDVIALLRKVADGLESEINILTDVFITEKACATQYGTESIGVTFIHKQEDENGSQESEE